MNKESKIQTSKIINDKEYKQIDDLKFTVFYNVHEIEKVNGRRSFICHLIMEDTLKVSNFKSFFMTQEIGVKQIREQHPDANKENSRVYIIYELRKGIRYLPDISMFNFGGSFTTQMADKYSLKFGGKVAIVGKDTKSYRFLKAFKGIYSRFTHFDIVSNLDEALEFIRSSKD